MIYETVLERGASAQWQESMPFNGPGARERAMEWLRAESKKMIEGVVYHCWGGTMSGSDTSALATRDWRIARRGILEWSAKRL